VEEVIPFLLGVPSAVHANFCLPGFGPHIKGDPERSSQIQEDLSIWLSRDPNALYFYRKGQPHQEIMQYGCPLSGGTSNWACGRVANQLEKASPPDIRLERRMIWGKNWREGTHSLP
jgi:hypothetical protein